MREALQQDGGQHCGDADKLYDEMWLLVHGLESEVDEGVEVGDAERAGGEDQQYEADGEHGPGETFGIMVGEDGVLQPLSSFEKGEEGEDHCQTEGEPEQEVGGLGHAAFESEQGLVEASCIGGGVDAEEHPAHVDDKEGEDDRWPLTRFLEQVLQEEFVGTDE